MAGNSNIYEISSFRGGLSDYEDKGIQGAFKFGSNLDIRKETDSLSSGQTLSDIGVVFQSASPSVSPSVSTSPSASSSVSISPSISPSVSVSPSHASPSSSTSPSVSSSPSVSLSRSASVSPSISVSPSVSLTPGSRTFTDLVHFFVKCSDGNTYGFGNTGKIYKITSEFVCTVVANIGQEIVGAIEKPSSSGNTYLLFATRTQLHIKKIPGLSNWNDIDASTDLAGWPKTNLTSADWHTMREVGGDIFIANGSTLAFVGYDDSYTNNALDLIPGNTAKTIVERNGRAIIGTFRASDPDKGINASIDTEVPLAQVGDNGEIYFANMSDSIPVKRIPGGGKSNPGGIANQVDQVNFFEWEVNALSWIDKQSVGNMALLGMYGGDTGKGGVYSYGRKNKNHPFVLNMEHLLDVDEIGAIESSNGITYASYKNGTDFGVKVTDNTLKATGTYEGLDFKAPVKMPVNITVWSIAELYMAPLPTGCSVEFWYRVNKNGSFVQAKVADGSTTFSTTGGKKAVFSISAEGEVFEPKVVLNPYLNTTPEIYRIRTYFA